MPPIDFLRLSRRLNYNFKNLKYLKQALTHRSASNENNERFEFIGDAILNFIIAQAVFERFPNNNEGELSRLRAFLVKEERLSEIALEIKLGDFLILGQGELKTGGFRRASTLADTLEAVFAAVFLDGGFEAVKQVIIAIYEKKLTNPELQNCIKDAKTRLQEFLQTNKLPLPIYTLVNIEGNEHEQIFYVQCEVPGMSHKTSGKEMNRRKAEQIAARAFINFLCP